MPSILHPYSLISAVVVLGAAWFLLPYIVRMIQVRRLARLCREQHAIVLTFDDGPSTSLTPRVAELLRQLGIKASFFPVGSRAVENPQIVQQIACDGHDIGSHTAQHLNAWKSLPVAHCRDMLEGHRQVVRLAGPTCLFRAPYGKMSLASLLVATMNRLSLAWWTIDARDSLARPRDHDDVLRQISRAGGGVVLLHDHDGFPDAHHGEYVLGLIQRIVALAAVEGLRFTTVSRLAGQAAPTAAAESTRPAVPR